MKDIYILLSVNTFFEIKPVIEERQYLESNFSIVTEKQEDSELFKQQGFSSCFHHSQDREKLIGFIKESLTCTKGTNVLLNVVKLDINEDFENITTNRWDEMVFANLTFAYLLIKEFIIANNTQKKFHIFNVACVNADYKENAFAHMFYNSLKSLTYCAKEEVRDFNIPVSFLEFKLENGFVNYSKILDTVEFCLTNSTKCTIDQVLVK